MKEELIDRSFKVEKVTKPNRNVSVVTFDKKLDAKPGQFVMLTIPGVGQKPFSISQNNPLELLIKSVGEFTQNACELQDGDDILVRGPIGKGTFPEGELSDNIYLIGGGTGIAALRLLAKNLKSNNITSFLGARTSTGIFFRDDFEKTGEVYVSTDDGSEGVKGTIIDLLKSQELNKHSIVSVCGPELMMVNVCSFLKGSGFGTDKIYLSLERLVKCGMGLCGGCEIGGYLLCQDGPVFNYSFISKNMPEFGKWKRDKTGKRVPI